MRTALRVMIAIFLLAAFSVGINMADSEMSVVNEILDNASIVATNFTIGETPDPYINGMFRVFEKFTIFSLTAGVEVMRVGILFGHDNPQYFETEFLMGIAKMLLWLLVVSMAIVPLMYLVAFLIMIIIWVRDWFRRRR